MRALKAWFVGATAALCLAFTTTEVLAQAVEFDLSRPLSRNRGQGQPMSGPALGRVTFYAIGEDGSHDTSIYSEELGYVTTSGGVAHLVVGSSDPEGFATAFGLDGHPDDNLFNGSLWVVLESCSRAVKNDGADYCDTSQTPAWMPWIENRLEAVPVASTVLSVPIFALPPEVVLQDELEAALAAERAAWEAAVAAVKAAVDAERARAEAAESTLSNGLNAEAAARLAADNAEAVARQAADTALAQEIAAVDARRAADALAAQQALSDEAATRASGDAAAVTSAQGYTDTAVGGLRSALATPGSGATVAWDNITGRSSAGFVLDSHVVQTFDSVTKNGCVLFCDPAFKTVEASCPDGQALTECSSSTTGRIGETAVVQSSASGRPACSASYDENGTGLGFLVYVTAACAYVR